METDQESAPVPLTQVRLASGEAILYRGRATEMALTDGMLSHRLWLRGEVGAMRIDDPPSGWNGEANWWLPEQDRRSALRALLPDLMPWLPPALDAPRKLHVADRMAFPAAPAGGGNWNKDALYFRRPFVDAVFVDDAAHLHLVDVVAATGKDALGTLGGWENHVRFRQLGRHWFHRGDSGSRFEAEYDKLCWIQDESPYAGICRLLESRGDEMPDATAKAFWGWVGRRCWAYWGGDSRPYELQDSPHCILITDGDMPSDERLLETKRYGKKTLACVTPFAADGSTWLRVDMRAWSDIVPRGALAESTSPAPNRTCRMAGATDVGKRRTANQDAVQWSEEEGWAAVADGMGGHPNGDVASATVLRVFSEAMRSWPDGLQPRLGVARRLRQAAMRANEELWKTNKGAGIFERMGTTLCALRLHDDSLSIVHAGDSRIYEIMPGGPYQRSNLRHLTQDHGEGGGLDRAVGLWEQMPFDMDTLPIRSGALYLLCTDGLTNMVNDGEIQSLCLRHMESDAGLESLPNALIDAANKAGGSDNITVCVVRTERPQP